MEFKKYQHIERFGNTEVEIIEHIEYMSWEFLSFIEKITKKLLRRD